MAGEMERGYVPLRSSFPAHLSVGSAARCQHGGPGFNAHNLQLKESANFPLRDVWVPVGLLEWQSGLF